MASSDPAIRRGDFKAIDLQDGAKLFYWENDDKVGEAVYRLTIHANSPSYFVLMNENISPLRRFIFTIFKPGTLQTVVILQRLSQNTFGVYMLNRTDKSASALSEGHESAYVNRSIALYRKLIGGKTDLKPPSSEWKDQTRSPRNALLALSSTTNPP